MKECKYRLPCNWCDRLDKYCDMVEPIEIKLSDTNKCNHDWVYDKTTINTAGRNIYYHCTKCWATKLEEYDVNGNYKHSYETGTEWQT